MRRSKGHAQSVVQTGDLIVNLDTKTVEVGGARVHLTGKEYKKLANASDGKDYIETVWGRGYMLREPQEVRISKACPRPINRDAA